MKLKYIILLGSLIGYQANQAIERFGFPEKKIKIDNQTKITLQYTIHDEWPGDGIPNISTGNLVPGNNTITIPKTGAVPHLIISSKNVEKTSFMFWKIDDFNDKVLKHKLVKKLVIE